MTDEVSPPVDISRNLIVNLCEQHGFDYVAKIVLEAWNNSDWKKRTWVESPLNLKLAGEMTPTERKAIHHMLWVWLQYEPHSRHVEGEACYLEHRNMQAGERATDFLEARGLARDLGYETELTKAGLAILDDESFGEE